MPPRRAVGVAVTFANLTNSPRLFALAVGKYFALSSVDLALLYPPSQRLVAIHRSLATFGIDFPEEKQSRTVSDLNSGAWCAVGTGTQKSLSSEVLGSSIFGSPY